MNTALPVPRPGRTTSSRPPLPPRPVVAAPPVLPPPLPLAERTIIVTEEELEEVRASAPPLATSAHTPPEPAASAPSSADLALRDALRATPGRRAVTFVRTASFFALYLVVGAALATRTALGQWRAHVARTRELLRAQWGRASARARQGG